jgi:formylglycine-generating enzyme
MKNIFAIVFLFAISGFVTAATIELVDVGNPGNAADTPHPEFGPRGSVNYQYQIGKFEITAGQYTEFLNAVAKDDPNQLYVELMADLSVNYQGCNIQRTGTPGNYVYSVPADWADRPVNWVSFWDAARFANWLYNGQPVGPQGPDTTENGAYHDLEQPIFGRNSSPGYFIPSLDEWYKAAFHKNDGVTGNYWDYATQSDTAPSPTLPDTGNNANFQDEATRVLTIGSPYYRTEVGEFALSDSAYGTFDQAGNVWEWNDTFLHDDFRGVGGGTYEFYAEQLRADRMSAAGAYSQGPLIGFRVALIPVPEPVTLVSLATAALGCPMLRQRR